MIGRLYLVFAIEEICKHTPANEAPHLEDRKPGDTDLSDSEIRITVESPHGQTVTIEAPTKQ